MAVVSVLGATGAVGRHVTTKALDAGHDVRAMVRRPDAVPPRPGLSVHRADILEPASLVEPLRGADIALCCVGTPAGSRDYVMARGAEHLARACDEAGCSRVAIISSVGVGDSAEQMRRSAGWLINGIVAWLLRRPFRDLGAAEDALRATDLNYILVRPTQLVNRPGTGTWRAQDTSGKVRSPIPREDVAAFMVSLVEDTTWDRRAVTVGRR